MKRGRNKYEKLDGGGTVSTPLVVSDPHLGDLAQIGVSGSEISSRSVYFAVCHRDWSACQISSPLYKVDLALSNSDSEDSEGSREPPGRVKLRRIATLETDIGGKTFISMESAGWIIGIGGSNPGGTIIFDTKDNKVIRGPKLIANKWCPVVAAVGYKIYALSRLPDFVEEPDFVPWFEVLDLSKATITETEEGLTLDACSWEALPYPLCFPCKLTPKAYRRPPFITVSSSVVVEPYILISLNQPTNCVYAFDTNTGKWHKIDDEYLPFVGHATQLGHGSSIFLASSRENGPINAYDIHVSVSSPENISSVADKGGALKLSITVFSIRNKHGEDVSAKKSIITSLGKKHFCELLSFEGCGRYLVYDKETKESYPGKLYVQLCTYQKESHALHGETSEIVVSCQQELTSRIRSSCGFSSAPIVFALSI
ncbi:uncharacterized protein LOC112270903 [Brachypodium distachyon]|uniref:Uncharacterized protein n=1 Tax=Brachypodium distachyon TaxID=15368 RepID=I1HBU5_BRADI|nr:uncharacterized protein LOC112270903 [Brachypodium distachyon]KQK02607.1 hypothetical protein BRADI_2g02640v3 [Brachypodium distachyon]|eukprot:XP_024315272.1 uncharacterized protein LOC112270903 [Brachypodium distachyon]